ncbi:hypothetical protein KKG71_00220 [Patescibacteria group bacterium]|nr:hypothetical protein [Patescibacteria group bacterium]
MEKRIDIQPGQQYGKKTEVRIEIIKITDTQNNCRTAIARVLSSSNHWQSLGEKCSLVPGEEITLQEVQDSWIIQPISENKEENKPWFVLWRTDEEEIRFEHYR